MLAIAVLCLILAGVFAPRIGVEAKANSQTQFVIEDVSNWLLHLATWMPTEVQLEHPACAETARTVALWGYL